MPRLIIANIDYLVTVDPSRRIIRDGALVIQDGRIVGVGKTGEFPSTPGDDVIDGRGKLALPGVFDTHVHNSQQLGRGCGDEAYSGPERLFRRLWPVEAQDKGDAFCAARLAQLEMIRAGTTCFADPGSYFSAETAKAVKESGMRGMIARTVFDMGQTNMGNLPKGFFEPTGEALVRADEIVAEFEGALDGRLKAWFSIRVPVAMSDDLLGRLGKLAEKRGVGIIGHACENRDETVASHLKYGMGDIARLEKLGLLGPNMLLLHMGWVDATAEEGCEGVAPFYSLTEHTRAPSVVIMSRRSWDELSFKDRAIIKDAARESARYMREAWRRAEDQSRDQAAKAAVRIVKNIARKPFEEATKPLRYELQQGDPRLGALIDRIEAAQ
jgi:cytosine/adenosine deaminase-related metal-dependent hydrolase